MTNTWEEMTAHVQALEEFVHTWASTRPDLEQIPIWRKCHGGMIHIDHADEIVNTAIWAMTDGQWKLAAELLDIVASAEIVNGLEGETKVERYRWGA